MAQPSSHLLRGATKHTGSSLMPAVSAPEPTPDAKPAQPTSTPQQQAPDPINTPFTYSAQLPPLFPPSYFYFPWATLPFQTGLLQPNAATAAAAAAAVQRQQAAQLHTLAELQKQQQIAQVQYEVLTRQQQMAQQAAQAASQEQMGNDFREAQLRQLEQTLQRQQQRVTSGCQPTSTLHQASAAPSQPLPQPTQLWNLGESLLNGGDNVGSQNTTNGASSNPMLPSGDSQAGQGATAGQGNVSLSNQAALANSLNLQANLQQFYTMAMDAAVQQQRAQAQANANANVNAGVGGGQKMQQGGNEHFGQQQVARTPQPAHSTVPTQHVAPGMPHQPYPGAAAYMTHMTPASFPAQPAHFQPPPQQHQTMPPQHQPHYPPHSQNQGQAQPMPHGAANGMPGMQGITAQNQQHAPAPPSQHQQQQQQQQPPMQYNAPPPAPHMDYLHVGGSNGQQQGGHNYAMPPPPPQSQAQAQTHHQLPPEGMGGYMGGDRYGNDASDYDHDEHDYNHDSDDHHSDHHARSRRKEHDGPMRCAWESCAIEYPNSLELAEHVREEHCKSESNDTQFVCKWNDCKRAQKPFPILQQFLRHMQTHTREKPYACRHPGCGQTFTQANVLAAHTRTHTGERPYKCEVPGCGKKFAYANCLLAHTRSHTGEKPRVCKVCGKGFSGLSNLTAHMRTHTGERPYGCNHEGCGKSFTTSSDLVRHMRIHSGVKPFECSVPSCSKRFTTSSQLNNHLRTHTGEKPFQCKHAGCDKRFADLTTLRRHQQSHDRKRRQETEIEAMAQNENSGFYKGEAEVSVFVSSPTNTGGVGSPKLDLRTDLRAPTPSPLTGSVGGAGAGGGQNTNSSGGVSPLIPNGVSGSAFGDLTQQQMYLNAMSMGGMGMPNFLPGTLWPAGTPGPQIPSPSPVSVSSDPTISMVPRGAQPTGLLRSGGQPMGSSLSLPPTFHSPSPQQQLQGGNPRSPELARGQRSASSSPQLSASAANANSPVIFGAQPMGSAAIGLGGPRQASTLPPAASLGGLPAFGGLLGPSAAKKQKVTASPVQSVGGLPGMGGQPMTGSSLMPVALPDLVPTS